jgi:hypothetical protein
MTIFATYKSTNDGRELTTSNFLKLSPSELNELIKKSEKTAKKPLKFSTTCNSIKIDNPYSKFEKPKIASKKRATSIPNLKNTSKLVKKALKVAKIALRLLFLSISLLISTEKCTSNYEKNQQLNAFNPFSNYMSYEDPQT